MELTTIKIDPELIFHVFYKGPEGSHISTNCYRWYAKLKTGDIIRYSHHCGRNGLAFTFNVHVNDVCVLEGGASVDSHPTNLALEYHEMVKMLTRRSVDAELKNFGDRREAATARAAELFGTQNSDCPLCPEGHTGDVCEFKETTA